MLKRFAAKIVKTVLANRGLFLQSFEISVKRRYEIFLEVVLEELLRTVGREFFFVQIGANDGVSNDPINWFVNKYNLRGIMVEPLPDVYARLKNNYPNNKYKDLQLINAAVNTESGSTSIYRISRDKEKAWKSIYRNTANASGVSSMDPNHIKTFLLRNAPDYFAENSVEEWIESITVPTLSVSDLWKKADGHQVHLVVVDTEGFDGKIVRMILRDVIDLPMVILFEHKVLLAEDRNSTERQLSEAGYSLFELGGDMCAVNKLNRVQHKN